MDSLGIMRAYSAKNDPTVPSHDTPLGVLLIGCAAPTDVKIVPVRLHSVRTKKGQEGRSIYSHGIARYKGRSSWNAPGGKG